MKVWAVELIHEAPLEEVEGSLALETDALVFSPKGGSRTTRRIDLASIRKVKRLRGSPVLMVVRDQRGMPARTAFYFVQPPPLDRPRSERQGFGGFPRNPQRKARRQNAGYFGVWNQEKKALIREWERAVRRAMPGR